jgi:hypothetical protein
MSEVDIYKFNKEVYRDRRNKGYTGQVHPPGSPQQRYDTRKMYRQMREDLKKGKHESKNHKTVKTNV